MERLIDESNTIYNYRVKFYEKFSNDNPTLKKKEYVKYSKIAANIKFKECKYDQINFNKVKKYLNI